MNLPHSLSQSIPLVLLFHVGTLRDLFTTERRRWHRLLVPATCFHYYTFPCETLNSLRLIGTSEHTALLQHQPRDSHGDGLESLERKGGYAADEWATDNNAAAR